VHRSQLDIAVSDPIRDRLDILLSGKIGPPPNDQAQIDMLSADGDQRFNSKIPPGFADIDKDKNPHEAIFYHDGLCYHRKFGDLILWKQLLNHAKENNVKSVLFITSDRKEDWWWREKGKTIGPRPELVREISRVANVELFWLYSSDQFLEGARHFANAEVSQESLSQLKDVVRVKFASLVDDELRTHLRDSIATHLRDSNARASDNPDLSPSPAPDPAWAERAVHRWLRGRFDVVYLPGGFPDFLVETPNGVHGYEVKYISNIARVLLSTSAVNAMIRGCLDVNEGRLSQLSLVLVSDKQKFIEDLWPELKEKIDDRLDRLLALYPISEIICGFIDEYGDFTMMTQRSGVRPKRADKSDRFDES
jgi:hypothetical protein